MTLREQLKNITLILVIVYAATTALLSIVILLGIEYNIELDHFTQDPAAITDSPFFIGFFSNVGVMLWCAGAVVCMFAWRAIPVMEQTKSVRAFLLYSSLLSFLLLFDDLFMMHEEVFPVYFGIPENAVYLFYLNLALIYAVAFKEIIFRSEYIFLILAAVLIGISTVIDTVPMPIPEDSFLEDTFKLFGIVSWFLFFVRFSFSEVKKII
jgi:hypothetical protein